MALLNTRAGKEQKEWSTWGSFECFDKPFSALCCVLEKSARGRKPMHGLLSLLICAVSFDGVLTPFFVTRCFSSVGFAVVSM